MNEHQEKRTLVGERKWLDKDVILQMNDSQSFPRREAIKRLN